MNTLYFDESLLSALLVDGLNSYLEGLEVSNNDLLELYKSMEEFGDVAVGHDGSDLYVEYMGK